MKKQLAKKYRRAESAMSSKVEDDSIILSAEQGKYFSFGPVGTLIWDQLSSAVTREELVDSVCARFEVDTASCGKDVDDFLTQLESAGLVEESKVPS